MRKLALSLIPLLLFAGCRLSRSPEALNSVQPAPSSAPVVVSEKSEGAQPEQSAQPEETTRPAEPIAPAEETEPPVEVAPATTASLPGARDYYDSLGAFLAQARAEADKGKIDSLLSPQGALAGANYSLGLLEASLPRVWALQGIARAQQLLAAKKNGEAAGVLSQLAGRLENAKAALPTDMKGSSSAIKKAQDNITAGKIDLASNQLGDLLKQVSTSTALTQIREIGANLQEAALAARRNQPAVVKAILEDTGPYTTKLGELLPAPQTRESSTR